MNILKPILYLYDLFPNSDGLIQCGNWRVRYNDGRYTRKMTHDVCADYAEMFGGKVVWVRYNDPAKIG